MKRKHRKPSGGVRHFLRAEKREKYISSIGAKGTNVVLVDNSLTKRKKYMDNKEGVFCQIRKQIIKLSVCLDNQKQKQCKVEDCVNYIL